MQRSPLVEKDGTTLRIKDSGQFGSDGQYGPVHNWDNDPQGAKLLLSDGIKGRSDFQNWLRDRREAYDTLIQGYSGESLAALEEGLTQQGVADLLQGDQEGTTDPLRGGAWGYLCFSTSSTLRVFGRYILDRLVATQRLKGHAGFKVYREPASCRHCRIPPLSGGIHLNSPLKKALLTGFHSTAKHNATKAVSPSSETMRTI